jgi:uncharacterized membrane protein
MLTAVVLLLLTCLYLYCDCSYVTRRKQSLRIAAACTAMLAAHWAWLCTTAVGHTAADGLYHCLMLFNADMR